MQGNTANFPASLADSAQRWASTLPTLAPLFTSIALAPFLVASLSKRRASSSPYVL